MSSQPEIRSERAGRMLGEAAEIMLGAMRGLGERLNAAETPEAAQGLAMALARVNRGLRQTLLLDARLEKDARAAAQAAEAEAAKAAEADIRAKKSKVRYVAGREIVEACESEDEAKERLDALDDHLDVYVRGFDFEAGTVEDLVEALLADLGIARDGEGDDDEDAAPAEAPEAPALEAGFGPPPEFDWAPPPDSS